MEPVDATSPFDDTDPHRTETANRMERALLVRGPRTEVVLVRHAQQLRAEQYGPTLRPGGPPLSDVGERQAEIVAELLVEQTFDGLYSSDLGRAIQTAQVINARHGDTLDHIVLPTLREIEVFVRRDGSPGIVPDEVLNQGAARFSQNRRWSSFPDSETSEELRTRLRTTIEDLVAQHENQRICVVAHGAAIAALIASILSTEEDMFFFPCHASVTSLFHGDGRWAVHTLNEIAHLRAADLVTF